MNEKDKNQRRYERHIRWQEIRVTQFGYVNYLILTLTSGALAYGALDLGKANNTPCSALYATYFYWWALFFLLISVVAGIVCAYVRLCDFRDTAKVAEYYYNGQKNYTDRGKRLKGDDEAARLHKKAEKFGECSWGLLEFQIFSFGLAILLFAAPILYSKFPY